MKPLELGVVFPQTEIGSDPVAVRDYAQAAEGLGYTHLVAYDHVIGAGARSYDSTRLTGPYRESDMFHEPLVLFGYLAGLTKTIWLCTGILVLPQRQAALVAKQAGSLVSLIGNRVGLGVGTSPWPEDYELMGVPFARRGKRMDECIEIIRGLTTGDYFEFHGEFYDIAKTKMTPAPTEPIPILIGGHADAALRRAARNDGWMHGGGEEDLAELLAKLNRYRAEEGTTDKDFQIHVISIDGFTADGVKRLEDKGVTDVIVGFRIPYINGPDTEPLDSKVRNLEWFAENVIAKV